MSLVRLNSNAYKIIFTLRVVTVPLSPSCVTRKKKTARKKWPREILACFSPLGVRAAFIIKVVAIYEEGLYEACKISYAARKT